MLLVQGEALSFDSLRCERSEQQLPPGCASDASKHQSNSGKQNTCEFIAVIAGLACLASLGINGVGVKIIGDNQSSLSWCANLRFHSQASKTAAIMFMGLTTVCDLQVVDEEHIRGEWNVKPDRLSRTRILRESRLRLSRSVSFWRRRPQDDVRNRYNSSVGSANTLRGQGPNACSWKRYNGE
jgi:hypothetical protein